ncbi:uncharacterized protein LOC117583863 [Drosophila guanche]|uniref:Uncharacterized protein n=1 Tax=Drosophila guanche TaxID=7266 RepID=A0A3B0JNN2_DROGU|nr:uncharacterized protein LOC117583863 [Drosophila guanche]SPP74936.1 Hypothetical predicted protein [Drosophila guanche]
MAIIRMYAMPPLFLLLLVFLDPNDAARVASDRVVFPTERAPNATESSPKPWQLFPDVRNSLRQTESNQVQPGSDVNGTRVEPSRNENRGETIPVAKNQTEETQPVSRNATRTQSEDKVIRKIVEGNRTDMAMAPMGIIPIGPRITLESIRVCPLGFTLSNDHCRKKA